MQSHAAQFQGRFKYYNIPFIFRNTEDLYRIPPYIINLLDMKHERNWPLTLLNQKPDDLAYAELATPKASTILSRWQID